LWFPGAGEGPGLVILLEGLEALAEGGDGRPAEALRYMEDLPAGDWRAGGAWRRCCEVVRRAAEAEGDGRTVERVAGNQLSSSDHMAWVSVG
jgi:hypothetical protein